MTQKASPSLPKQKRKKALSEEEEQTLLLELMSERFMDMSPRQVYYCLLDEGKYLHSISTMYRTLRKYKATPERRRQRKHTNYVKPQLKATAINQVWTWDITLLIGTERGVKYYLYVILDIYSRYIVGWMVADRECQYLAKRLMEETCKKYGILPGTLIIHSDRGPSMKSKTVEELLSDLGVTKSHSRPHVSNDNPFSEAGFKTLKYSRDFPGRFSSLSEAEAFLQEYFDWYNTQHYHSGIANLTPEQVYSGKSDAILATRQQTLEAAYAKNPGRFHRCPKVEELPKVVYINAPIESTDVANTMNAT